MLYHCNILKQTSFCLTCVYIYTSFHSSVGAHICLLKVRYITEHVTREEKRWWRVAFELVDSDKENKGKACELCINKGMFAFVSNSATFAGSKRTLGRLVTCWSEVESSRVWLGALFAWAHLEAFAEYTELLNCSIVTSCRKCNQCHEA
jgi:hypothetical protein